MLTKPCPDCGDDIAVFSRKHRCGWVAGQSGAKTDPDWRLCADVSRGDRCSQPGVVSQSTHGGRFYGNCPEVAEIGPRRCVRPNPRPNALRSRLECP